MKYLPPTTRALLLAARSSSGIEVHYVDNGSTDGSFEFLESITGPDVFLHRLVGATISALRNFGASRTASEFVSFVDADCIVAENYFDVARSELLAFSAEATGCRYDLPAEPHWLESAWHGLHDTHDGYVEYLNAGNLFVRRSAFAAVGGFDESLYTGEDAELGQRLVRAGFRIRQSKKVAAVHLGNPKSIRAFFRQMTWHGLGMFATVSLRQIDKPVAMLALHLTATTASVALVLVAGLPLAVRAAVLVGGQSLVPGLTLAYRIRRVSGRPPIVRGLFLYWLYYWARASALARLIGRRARNYRK